MEIKEATMNQDLAKLVVKPLDHLQVKPGLQMEQKKPSLLTNLRSTPGKLALATIPKLRALTLEELPLAHPEEELLQAGGCWKMEPTFEIMTRKALMVVLALPAPRL